MTSVEQAITEGWGWAVRSPVTIIIINDFGNVVVQDSAERYFRITLEDLSCCLFASTSSQLASAMKSLEFQRDWAMQPLRAMAEEAHGALESGQCYHLIMPSVLGGPYSIENVRRISLIEHLAASGVLARQIHELPDGSKVILRTT